MFNLIDGKDGKDDKDEYIKNKVFWALSDLGGFDIRTITEEQDLGIDLGLDVLQKRSLKSYFQNILSDLKSSKIISVTECENLEKVSDCLKLIKSKL